jgi:hypothetical protein
LSRGATWPRERQQELAELALEIEAEFAGEAYRGRADERVEGRLGFLRPTTLSTTLERLEYEIIPERAEGRLAVEIPVGGGRPQTELPPGSAIERRCLRGPIFESPKKADVIRDLLRAARGA